VHKHSYFLLILFSLFKHRICITKQTLIISTMRAEANIHLGMLLSTSIEVKLDKCSPRKSKHSSQLGGDVLTVW
jgi:hypothetical protein